jgi:hypothetical protein
MSYITVFEITEKPFEWWFSAIGLIGVALGILIVLVGRKWPSRRRSVLSGYVMAAFCALWSTAAFIASYSQYRNCMDAYQSKTYQIAEGRIEDFRPMPFTGHQDECFSVQDHRFCYSDYAIQAGFNRSTSHGGPIRDGLPVRIAYFNGQILRLDIGFEWNRTTHEH